MGLLECLILVMQQENSLGYIREIVLGSVEKR